MNITELKELAKKATPGPWVAGDDEDSDYFLVGPCGDDGIVYQSVVKLHSETNADYIAAANPAAMLELIAKLEDAQGEIRALRATEAGLIERAKVLEEGLRFYADPGDYKAPFTGGLGKLYFDCGLAARAILELLEKKE